MRLFQGEGSFGKVYEGEWQRLKVAIKSCNVINTEAVQEFINEASLMMYVNVKS